MAQISLVIGVLRRLFEVASALCFVVMTMSITVQVIGRYLLPLPIADATEISSFAQVWLVCLGSGLAVRHQAMFAVDLFGTRLSPAMWTARRVLIALLGLVFVAALLKGSMRMLVLGQFQTAPTLQIPMWTIYLALPIGLSYFLLELVVAIGEGSSPQEESRHET